MTLFRCQVYLAVQRPTNWGHHLQLSKVVGDVPYVRHKHRYVSEDLYGLTSLSEKTRKSCQLQMLEQRQYLLNCYNCYNTLNEGLTICRSQIKGSTLLLNYFKTLSSGPAANRTRASCTIDWHLTNQANQTAVGY